MELLLKSKAVLSKLTEAVGAIQKAHIIEKVAQIDNNLRFCRYQLNEYAGNYDELMQMQRVLNEDPTYSDKIKVGIFLFIA